MRDVTEYLTREKHAILCIMNVVTDLKFLGSVVAACCHLLHEYSSIGDDLQTESSLKGFPITLLVFQEESDIIPIIMSWYFDNVLS